jgi:cell division protein FtsB
MITLTEIEAFLIAILPAVTSIATTITALITIIKSLGKLRDNEKLKTERDALVEQNKTLVNEVKKSQKMMAIYIEKAAHIVYNDLSEVKDDETLKV